MIPAARLTDQHVCPQVTAGVPHVGGPILSPGMPNVLIGGMPASRLADFALCVGPLDTISKGAATVLTGGLPAVRLTDMTIHGGMVAGPGALTVLINGPAFAIPANFKFEGSPAFMNKVVRDLFLLSTTPTGRALLQRLEAAGETVTFREHTGINDFCNPVDSTKAKNGEPTGSVIRYNPDYRSNAYDSSGNMIPQPPQAFLAHEMVHALNNSEGTHHYGTDPNPPASERGISEEEASAIGTGSHNGDPVTENGVRNDLGMPRRDNHIGTGGPAPGEPTPLEIGRAHV